MEYESQPAIVNSPPRFQLTTRSPSNSNNNSPLQKGERPNGEGKGLDGDGTIDMATTLATSPKVEEIRILLESLRIIYQHKDDQQLSRVLDQMMTCLNSTSSPQERMFVMTLPEFDLLNKLLEIIQSTNNNSAITNTNEKASSVITSKARSKSLQIIWDLARVANQELLIFLASLQFGLTQELIRIIQIQPPTDIFSTADGGGNNANAVSSTDKQAKVNALGTLWTLAKSAENRKLFVSTELHLLPVIIDVLRTDKQHARTKALGFLRCLTQDSLNRVILGTPKLGLIRVLTELLKEDRETRLKSLYLLQDLAMIDSNESTFHSTEIGIVTMLCGIVRADKSICRLIAVNILWTLSVNAVNGPGKMMSLVAPDLSLIVALIEIIHDPLLSAGFTPHMTNAQSSGSGTNTSSQAQLQQARQQGNTARIGCLGLIRYFSILPENRMLLTHPQLALLPLLVEVLRLSRTNGDQGEEEARVFAIGTLWTLAQAIPEVVHALGLSSLLISVIREDDDIEVNAHALAILWILSLPQASWGLTMETLEESYPDWLHPVNTELGGLSVNVVSALIQTVRDCEDSMKEEAMTALQLLSSGPPVAAKALLRVASFSLTSQSVLDLTVVNPSVGVSSSTSLAGSQIFSFLTNLLLLPTIGDVNGNHAVIPSPSGKALKELSAKVLWHLIQHGGKVAIEKLILEQTLTSSNGTHCVDAILTAIMRGTHIHHGKDVEDREGKGKELIEIKRWKESTLHCLSIAMYLARCELTHHIFIQKDFLGFAKRAMLALTINSPPIGVVNTTSPNRDGTTRREKDLALDALRVATRHKIVTIVALLTHHGPCAFSCNLSKAVFEYQKYTGVSSTKDGAVYHTAVSRKERREAIANAITPTTWTESLPWIELTDVLTILLQGGVIGNITGSTMVKDVNSNNENNESSLPTSLSPYEDALSVHVCSSFSLPLLLQTIYQLLLCNGSDMIQRLFQETSLIALCTKLLGLFVTGERVEFSKIAGLLGLSVYVDKECACYVIEIMTMIALLYDSDKSLQSYFIQQQHENMVMSQKSSMSLKASDLTLLQTFEALLGYGALTSLSSTTGVPLTTSTATPAQLVYMLRYLNRRLSTSLPSFQHHKRNDKEGSNSDEGTSMSLTSRHRHVMISYRSQSCPCQTQLPIKIGEKEDVNDLIEETNHDVIQRRIQYERICQLDTQLRRLGVDVWREHEGSSLVTSYNIEKESEQHERSKDKTEGKEEEKDRLWEAVQRSEYYVLCVTEPLLLSTLSRIEVSYAKLLITRSTTGHGSISSTGESLKMLYVIMDDEFTPMKSNICKNSWVGHLIGGDPWLTMSQTEQVSTVAKAIHIIADTSRVGANPMPTVTATGTETAETTTTTSHHVHIGSAANYGKTVSPTTTTTTTTAATTDHNTAATTTTATANASTGIASGTVSQTTSGKVRPVSAFAKAASTIVTAVKFTSSASNAATANNASPSTPQRPQSAAPVMRSVASVPTMSTSATPAHTTANTATNGVSSSYGIGMGGGMNSTGDREMTRTYSLPPVHHQPHSYLPHNQSFSTTGTPMTLGTHTLAWQYPSQQQPQTMSTTQPGMFSPSPNYPYTPGTPMLQPLVPSSSISVTPSTTLPPLTTSNTVVTREEVLTTIWKILSTEKYSTNYSVLQDLLNEVGIFDIEDLNFLDDELIQEIGKCLKLVPRKNLMVLMNRLHSLS